MHTPVPPLMPCGVQSEPLPSTDAAAVPGAAGQPGQSAASRELVWSVKEKSPDRELHGEPGLANR